MKSVSSKFLKASVVSQTAKHVLAGALVFLISLVSAGFYQFATQAAQEASLQTLPKADAIVVLTGEDNRIHSAVELLQAKNGKRLLISGVSTSVTDTAIFKAYAPKTANAFCCIDLDRLALDTKGNAEYTAKWAKLHDFNRIIVVTSSYHMPRSLNHLRQTMPSVDLIPAQVIPSDLKGKSTLFMMTSPKIIIEYAKYLVTRAKLGPVVKYMWTSLEMPTRS